MKNLTKTLISGLVLSLILNCTGTYNTVASAMVLEDGTTTTKTFSCEKIAKSVKKARINARKAKKPSKRGKRTARRVSKLKTVENLQALRILVKGINGCESEHPIMY